MPLHLSSVDHDPDDPPSVTPEPVIFDQTVSEEICVAHEMSMK